ncbi:MAG: ABC-F family ATP-binding cassette domain-containing protein [Candidatus Tenebribacter burtonii]|nr:ABC-F family ATP-binding cassette domain-containing protein [Candidatus Tenebribacter burtonii]
MSKNIISIEELNKSFAEKLICKNNSFGIFENEKIGLVGINGCGKSTLLKLIVGIEPVDSGKITFRKNIRTGYLPQIPKIDPDKTIYEEIYFSDHAQFELLRKYYRILNKLETKPTKTLEEEHYRIIKEIEVNDAWKIEVKAKSILDKFGFNDINQKISTLSGGQKRRIDLARVLMDEPDVLLLDEPTNHLDIDTIEWFQDYLSNYKGTIIFVTHDRYFLDAVSDKIIEMENGKIYFFKGNYSYYLRKKEQQDIDVQRKETRRNAQLKKELKWLQRGARARTSKPKDHLDRVKELIDKSYLSQSKDLDISFKTKRLGKTILEIKNISKRYDDKVLFKNFNHNFQKLERIGIIGINGCGKTTLLKCIMEEIEPDSGSIKVGINTSFSYFEQYINEFDNNQTVLGYIQEFAHNIRTADGALHSASEMLQRFLFDGKMQQSKLENLSGGEKKRLYLLRSLMFGSNFIILDEPTNDLDIRTLEILEDYLDAFKGCIIVVSHDRYFLDRVTDYLLVFDDDRIIKFPGNYSDFLLVKKYRDEENKKRGKKLESKNKKIKKVSHKLNFNEKREIVLIEKDMKNIEDQISIMNTKIEKEASSLSPTDFKEITDKLKELNARMDELESRWLELDEKN